MTAQVIQKDGKPEWAVIPYEEYRRLLEASEMLRDIAAYDAAKDEVSAGEPLIPAEVAYALAEGESPIRAWREYRELTQRQLARVAEISVPYLSQLESGKRTGSAEVLAAIARGLDVSLDDLVDA
jgi:DNA-binding XRE family transcriptional regulator